MKRSFLEEFGIEKEVIDKIMEANGKDINAAKASIDSEGLKKQISELEKELSDVKALHKSEIEKIIVDNAITNALVKANAKTEKAVKALIDMDSIKINDKGEVCGLREQLEKLIDSEDTAYLFNNTEIVGTSLGESEKEPEVDFNNMNYTQMCAYLEKN
ncbi:MAG: phage scaffolding protein [Lachnospirales bacterium]